MAKETVFKIAPFGIENMNNIRQYLYIGKLYSIMNSKHNQGQVMKRVDSVFISLRRIEEQSVWVYPYGFFCINLKEFLKELTNWGG